MSLDDSDIHIAQFLTETIKEKLSQAIGNTKKIIKVKRFFIG